MKFVITMAGLVGLWTIPAFGSGITVSATEPADNIEISQTVLSSYSNDKGGPYEAIRKTANNSNNWRELGQTFTVSSTFTLDKISLLVSQATGSPTSGLNLYMDVYSATSVASHHGTSLTGYPDSGVMPLLSTTHATMAPTPTPAEALYWMTFDVANVELTPGIYGFRIGHDTADFNLNYQLGQASNDIGGIYMHRYNPDLEVPVDIYSGGQAYRYHPFTDSLAVSLIDGLSDLVFVLQSAIPLPGDHNHDNKVNAADYVLWRKMNIDGAQGYIDWRQNFGNSIPSGGVVGTSGASSVPEPTAWLLMVTAILGACVSHRRR